MTPVIAIGLFVVIATILSVIGTVRTLRSARSHLPDELLLRRRALRKMLDDIIARVPSRPRIISEEVPDHPQAASVEAKLLAGNTDSALAEVESLLVRSPEDARVSLLLARVLIHCNEFDAAAHQLESARARGACGPMLDYLEGRAHYSLFARQFDTGDRPVQESPMPTLITPFEMFMLQLEQQRQRSDEAAQMWIASAGTLPIEHARIQVLLTEYFRAYCESLEKLAAAALSEPSFGDALYHTARLAMKTGFIEQGMTLLRKIEPLMATSAERQLYQRDISTLSGNAPPAVQPVARRSTRLKVLN